MDSYIVRLTRHEVVRGENKPEEVMLFKFRKEPWSVYFKWIGPAGFGREVVFVKGHYENKMHTLLAAGDMPLAPAGKRMALAPDSIFVRNASRHPITEAGLGASVERLGHVLSAVDRGDYRYGTLNDLGTIARPEFARPVAAIEHVLPPGMDPNLPRGGRCLYCFDPDNNLPTLVTVRDDRGQEVEYYRYDRLQFPVRLDDNDFNPDKLWAPGRPRAVRRATANSHPGPRCDRLEKRQRPPFNENRWSSPTTAVSILQTVFSYSHRICPQSVSDERSTPMIRWTVAASLATVCVLGWRDLPAARAAEGDELIGTWEGMSGAGGFKETWTIKNDKGEWSVVGIFKKDGKEVGMFQGQNCKYTRGVLVYQQQFVTKPDPGWGNGTLITAKATGDKLSFTWNNGRQSGPGSLKRAGGTAVATRPGTDPVKPNDPVTQPKTEPKTEPKATPSTSPEESAHRHLGEDERGPAQIWSIHAQDGKWSVLGQFYRKDKLVGTFHGENMKLINRSLTFVQKFDIKPVPGWGDGTKLSATPERAKLTVAWGSGFGDMTRSDFAFKDDAKAVVESTTPVLLAMTNEGKKEIAALAGVWDFSAIVLDGKKIEFKAFWFFKDATVGEYIDRNTQRRVGTFVPDPTKTPKMIDVNFVRGSGAATGLFQGIYELDGDTLKICFGTEKGRPTDMTSTEGSKNLLMVFKRRK